MDKIRAWCDLCRAPIAVTMMIDPLAGALLAGVGLGDTLAVISAMLAAGCLFVGGVILNDLYDFKRDLAENPGRPLPARVIPRYQALLVLILLLVIGMAFAPMAGPTATGVAFLLLATGLAFNVILKSVPLAPVVLGIYRMMNLWLGMAIVSSIESDVTISLRTYLAVAIGIYATGIAIFMRKTGYFDGPQRFLTGAGTMALAALLLPLIGVFFPKAEYHEYGNLWVAALIGVFLWQMPPAIRKPERSRIRSATTAALLGAIAFDAAAVAILRGTGPSLIVLLLLIPAIRLHRWMQPR